MQELLSPKVRAQGGWENFFQRSKFGKMHHFLNFQCKLPKNSQLVTNLVGYKAKIRTPVIKSFKKILNK